MVLVDTSIWIRFLAGTEPYANTLDRRLSGDEVLGHDFVGGLLIVDRGSRAQLLAQYKLMRQALVANPEVVELPGTTRSTAAELDGLTPISSLQRLSQIGGSGPRIAHWRLSRRISAWHTGFSVSLTLPE